MKNVIIRSLRFKLCYTLGILVTVAAVLVGFIRYRMAWYRTDRNFDQDLLEDARFLASHCQIKPGVIVWNAGNLPPKDVLRFEELKPYTLVSDSSGKLLSQDQHSASLQALMSWRELGAIMLQRDGIHKIKAADGTVFCFANVLIPPGDASPGNILHLARSMESMRDVLNEYLIVYGSSIPLILISAAAVGWFWAKRALRPFEEIAHTAEQITSKNLGARITSRHHETEVQRLVQSFNAMVGRLHESFQQMRQFNADAAHELRTPLAILQGENEIALRSSNLPEDIRTVLSSNLEELERLTHIVNDMLVLAEADADTQVLEIKSVNLQPLIHDLIEQMQLLAQYHRVDIEASELPAVAVEGDPLWLRRAFLNLLDNSIKYSKEGTKILVDAEVNGTEVKLRVSDNGIGIAPEDLPRIFDRLYRADPARSRASGGTGLGLSMVKWIVEAHRGHIGVSSSLGSGTTFEISLPLAPSSG